MNGVFDKYYKKYDSWYDKHKFAYLSELEAIKKALPRDAKGLEIGVGTGRFAAPLGIDTGVDPSKQMLKIARKRGVRVKLGYAEKLPFVASGFDYAAIIITLCFVKDPLKALGEAGRVLKKNGKLIVGIIDKDSFLGKFYQKKETIFYRQARFFSVKEVARLLREAGFIKLSYYQTLFRLPDKIDLIEKPKRGFSQGGFVIISAEKR